MSSTEHPETGPDVTITIDNKNYSVHRGSIPVSELKSIGGIPAAYELEEIVDGKLSATGRRSPRHYQRWRKVRWPPQGRRVIDLDGSG